MIVFNEKQIIEQALELNERPDHMSVRNLLRNIAKYYYDQCRELSSKQYARIVLDRMNDFKLPLYEYQEWKYGNWLYSYCLKLRNGKESRQIKEINDIVITKPEMDLIHSAQSEKHRKLLFTLYVLAKNRITPTGWVNYSLNDIFKLANVSAANNTERCYLLGDLYHAGLTDINHMVGKTGDKVTLIDGEPEMIITDFKNLGNQYLAAYKSGWTMCRKCGRMIKIKSEHDFSTKYCKKCAEIVNRDKTLTNMRKLREKDADIIEQN